MTDRKSALEAFGGWRGVALLTVGFIFAVGFERWYRDSSGSAMKEVAQELGLSVEKTNRRYQLRGRLNDMGVAVEHTYEFYGSNSDIYTRFRLYPEGGPNGKIVGKSLRQQVIKGLAGQESLSTGDEAFDAAVLVVGEPDLLTYLRPDAREAVMRATAAGWYLDGATWESYVAGRMRSAEGIRGMLDVGLTAAAATRGRDPGSTAGASADGGSTIPDSFTRAEALAAVKELNTELAFAAAVSLAENGDYSQPVQSAIHFAFGDATWQKRAIEVMGRHGDLLEIALLTGVAGDNADAAQAAREAIEARRAASP